MATVLPTSACAALDEPAFFYDAGPSLPTGRDLSSRPVVVLSETWETSALTAMLSLVLDNVPWDMSAVPTKIPRSDGLIGDA